MPSRLVFTEGNHTYSLDGQRVLSVSAIKNAASKQDGLVWAAAKESARWGAIHASELQAMGEDSWVDTCTRAHRRAWDRARDDGTLLHKLAESLVYGDPLPAHDPSGVPWPDDIWRCAQQLARFYDAWDVMPVIHEAFVFHEALGYAGRIDLLADLAGVRWLLDYKTGATGVWPETALQLTGYSRCTHIVDGDRDVPMPEVQRAGAVWLRPDNWQLIPVRIDDAMWDVFRAAIPVARFRAWRKQDTIADPLPVPETA